MYIILYYYIILDYIILYYIIYLFNPQKDRKVKSEQWQITVLGATIDDLFVQRISQPCLVARDEMSTV